MSTGKFLSLADRRNDLTRQAILDAALQMLERATLAELTVRAVAKQANVSERTVFRYFTSREEFLDAVADAVRARLALPPPPRTRQDLLDAARELYRRFEEKAKLTRASLHTELFHRIRETTARTRWQAVREIVDGLAPRASERARRIAAANIRYYLAASTWHYLRVYMGLSLEDTIACAETAIRQALEGLKGK